MHIPFCAHKCHYCDFNSHARAPIPWRAYADALCRELAHWAGHPAYRGRTLASIFFGGGTPSLAEPWLIARVLAAIRAAFPCSHDCEITLEANPDSVSAARLAAWRTAGINRLSIGTQSLNDRELDWLERIHDRQQALDAFAHARAAGFANINLDLMYGLPEQTLDDWLDTLNEAIALEPEHLSCYQLTVEPGTRLARMHNRQPLPLPNEEASLTFLFATRKRLAEQGYRAYEVSNFARAGRHCRHNDAYWRYRDYLGIGAGAFGKFDRGDRGAIRYGNLRGPERYMRQLHETGHAIAQQEEIPPRLAAAEAVWLGLRRTDGIDCRAFAVRFGATPWRMFAETLAPFAARGLLDHDAERLRLSETGLALADDIAAAVIQAAR